MLSKVSPPRRIRTRRGETSVTSRTVRMACWRAGRALRAGVFCVVVMYDLSARGPSAPGGPRHGTGGPPRRRISVSLTLSVPASESPGASRAFGHLPASVVADAFETLDGFERVEDRHSRQRRVRSLALHHVVGVHEHHADAVVLEAGQRLGEHGPGHRV